ncbi:MAG: hypothetical protein HYX68_27655 [Planctomycetes bacterium]|nr:hypothetical protein [Planctomycetota bacterium]
MADQDVMLEHARKVLRASPECDEAALRTLLTVRFLHEGESDPGGGGAGGGEVMAIFFVCLWPFFILKWLAFRRRLREFNEGLDAVTTVLRQEGWFAGDRSQGTQ